LWLNSGHIVKDLLKFFRILKNSLKKVTKKLPVVVDSAEIVLACKLVVPAKNNFLIFI
jgi:hypothetical protein